jgi:hypothetical protein
VGASEGAAEIVIRSSMDSIMVHFDRVAHAHTPGTLRCLLGLTTIWAFLVFETATGEFSKQRTRVHLRENPQCFQDNCPMQ